MQTNIQQDFVLRYKHGLHGMKSRLRTRQPTFIVVHHTATSSPARTVRALKSKGLSTHYEIDTDGTVYEYFDPSERVCYHVGELNSGAIGIDLTHKTGSEFPDVQMEALVALLNALCGRFGILPVVAPEMAKYYKFVRNMAGELEFLRLRLPTDAFGIYRHCNCSPTQCPDGAPIEKFMLPKGTTAAECSVYGTPSCPDYQKCSRGQGGVDG